MVLTIDCGCFAGGEPCASVLLCSADPLLHRGFFDPVDDAEALVEIDIDYMDYPLRFGVNYTISGG